MLRGMMVQGATTPSAAVARAVEKVTGGDPALQEAHWGLIVEDSQGQVLYEHDADRLFNPASNLKLVTAAAARGLLGNQARFHTKLMAQGSIDGDGVLHGDLCLAGGGDPSLTTADLQQAVQDLHIKRVDGNVVVDDRAFQGSKLGPGWAWDNFSAPYSAEADALTLDENTATLQVNDRGATALPDVGYLTLHDHVVRGGRTDVNAERQLGGNDVDVTGSIAPGESARFAVTVHDPGVYAGAILKSLTHATGQVERGVASGQTLWDHQSPTLLDLESHMLKASDNLYGETLIRDLAGGRFDQAPALEKETLHLPEPAVIVDGSGLSRDDLVSPRLLAGVLQQNYRDPQVQDTLPIAGVDGTLRHRMEGLKGRVHAKTGTLDGVSSLSGWLTLPSGQQVAFSWICNGYTHGGEVKATEDRLIEAIDSALS
ncbi:MAG: D-alanyl-D-alanine carboxypeptidase/D-alanyl-D-alanine endopeptidase [Candidatus Xenobia bacterium]